MYLIQEPLPLPTESSYSFEDIQMSLNTYERAAPKKKGRKKRSELEASGVFVNVKQKSTKGVYREDSTKLGRNDNPLIIYKHIKGMCVPLPKSLNEMEPSSLNESYFFPFVDKHHDKHGFMFQEPDGSYRNLPQQKWRSILHGKQNQLRPKENMEKNNRATVEDAVAGIVQICYWPDLYYETYDRGLNNTKTKKMSKAIANEIPSNLNLTAHNNALLSQMNPGPLNTIIKTPTQKQLYASPPTHYDIAMHLLNNSSFKKYHYQ